jgi:hypothetical protein
MTMEFNITKFKGGSEDYHFELSSPATEIKVQMISVCTSSKASDDLTLGACQSPLSG